MSGGARYWNEETQRWEDGDEEAAPVTLPPPPRPDAMPPAPGAEGGGQPGEWWSTQPSGGTGEQPGGAGAWPSPDQRGGGAGPAPQPPGAGISSAPEPSGGGTWPTSPTPGGTWSARELPSGTSWPPADHTTPMPAASRRYSHRFVWSVLGGAAAAGVATALVLTLVLGGDDSDRRTDDKAASASPSPSAEPSAFATEGSETPADETPSPSVPATEVPAGYELYDDPERFTIARPAGWVRQTVPSQYGMAVVNYRSSDGERRLQVYQVAESSPDESFRLFLSDQTPKPDGFEELSLENLDDGEFTGSRLEYLADSLRGEPDIGAWHVYDERFVAADGNIYAIAAYGPDADGRDDELELLTTALSHFCPPYTSCGADAGLD